MLNKICLAVAILVGYDLACYSQGPIMEPRTVGIEITKYVDTGCCRKYVPAKLQPLTCLIYRQTDRLFPNKPVPPPQNERELGALLGP